MARRALLEVERYDVSLDLTADATFASRTRINFTSRGGQTFLDLKSRRLDAITLDGDGLDPGQLEGGRFPLHLSPGSHELVVEAEMAFRNDGEGLHLHVDPADGRRYVYAMSFMDAAPSIFACFDQPDLKAPFTLTVLAPEDWSVIGNAPGTQTDAGRWEFAPTPPLSTYFVTLVAGPYHVITDSHDGIALGLSARRSLAGALDREADELLTLTRQCFDEFHRLFGIRYPFGNYHQAFVPEFNAGAMENPGCVTYRDAMVFESRVTRAARIHRATTIAHEMAHQWFGNIVTPQWWDDLWLNESFAEYMGNRVTADVTAYTDAWTHNAYARRQWGLVADQRPSTHPVAGNGAADAATALQNFDGISYSKGSSILKQLNAQMGDDVFFAGVVDHLQRHRFGNATMHDLFAAWERAGAIDLSDFAASWLHTAGPDTLSWEPATASVLRTSPAGPPAGRVHTFRVATAGAAGTWSEVSVRAAHGVTPVDVEAAAVVIDPYEDTWAATLLDRASIESLVELLPRTEDPRLRAGAVNALRTGIHQATTTSSQVLAVLESTLATEENDDALSTVVPWALRSVVPLHHDPTGAQRRLHDAVSRRLASATEGSDLQLAAFQSVVASTTSVADLQRWLDGHTPPGLHLDLDLRWAVLVRLATLDAVGADDLDRHLEAEPTARSRVEHARARASRPDAEAKAWAWARVAGEVDVSNHELEAVGLGLWRPGQERWTSQWVDPYFSLLPSLPTLHAGWVLGTAVRSFFPLTSLDPLTLQRAEAVLGQEQLDQTVRRNLVDLTDELARRLRVVDLSRTAHEEAT